ncbi:hypothetical protein PSACC_01899, partial [Paramicrosporidium saccamoebae]
MLKLQTTIVLKLRRAKPLAPSKDSMSLLCNPLTGAWQRLGTNHEIPTRLSVPVAIRLTPAGPRPCVCTNPAKDASHNQRACESGRSSAQPARPVDADNFDHSFRDCKCRSAGIVGYPWRVFPAVHSRRRTDQHGYFAAGYYFAVPTESLLRAAFHVSGNSPCINALALLGLWLAYATTIKSLPAVWLHPYMRPLPSETADLHMSEVNKA